MHKLSFNKFYFIDKFEKNNIKIIDKNTSIIFRNYDSKINYQEIVKIKKFCEQKRIKFYIANHLKLAIKMNCDGLYLPSFNKHTYTKGLILKNRFEILGSAHNIKEIRQKERQGVKIIFVSSIFKKNKNYLGLYKFNTLKSFTKKKVVALGGINSKNIKLLKLINLWGFSGISYFKKKPPQ
tara:strand:- start:302 stop:844 length:543 start_codon:yes stop_codon:yes gene_type:complete